MLENGGWRRGIDGEKGGGEMPSFIPLAWLDGLLMEEKAEIDQETEGYIHLHGRRRRGMKRSRKGEEMDESRRR